MNEQKTISKMVAAESSGSDSRMTTSSSARDRIGLVPDRKGKRPEEVPLVHPPSPKEGTSSQRACAAIKILYDMGFKRREVNLALNGLLKKTECNWEYIEENNFSALVNAVLLARASHPLETTNKSIVAESLGSIPPHMTQSTCTGETVGLDLLLSDRKGKRPLNERADNLTVLKRPKIEVPLVHPPPEDGTTNQRAYAVIKILHKMGFERREVSLALKRLLKKTERNWEYIEENNFSALVNAVLLARASHPLETTNKRIIAESSGCIPHMTQSTSTGETVGLDMKRPKIKVPPVHPPPPEDGTAQSTNIGETIGLDLKRLKIKVPPMHPPPPEDGNDRETMVIKEMKNMGFEEKDIVPVLERLLKESHNNWQYIELDNYSALVDGILIPEAASTEQNGKQKANQMPERLKYTESLKLDSGVESHKEEINSWIKPLESHKEEINSWIKPLVPLLENAGFNISGCGEILQKTPGHFNEMWEPKERPKYCGLGYDSNNTCYMFEERPKRGLYGAFVPRQLDAPLEENSNNEIPAQANQTLSTGTQDSLERTKRNTRLVITYLR